MTLRSSGGIRPRLRAFFSSRFDTVEARQSLAASLVAAAETSVATLFVTLAIALAMVLLEAAPAVAEPFFFTISGDDWEISGGLKYAVVRRRSFKKEEQRRKKAVKRRMEEVKGGVTKGLSRRTCD
jgi:hypothetical protein